MTTLAPINLDFPVMEALREHDTSEARLPTRVAERIVEKGFDISFFEVNPGVREGFRWGRSSHGVTTREVWTIYFLAPDGTEHAVCVVVQKVSYTKCNPYDRVPNHRPESGRVQATDEVKAVLGWKETAA